MIHTSFAIMRLFFHNVSIIFNILSPGLSKTLDTNVPSLDFGEHHKICVSIRCHLQNGIRIMHPLQGQTSCNWQMPDLGCQQGGEEQSIPFL
jgi:hypothetical protein